MEMALHCSRGVHRRKWIAGLLAGVLCGVMQAGAQKTATPPPSPFGIGADYHTGKYPERWMPQMSAIGIRTMRACAAEQLSYMQSLHIECGGLLYATPPNDTKDEPGTLPVKDLAAWSAYVTDQVKRAKGRIKYWEIWNEPPNGTGKDQTAADYAKIVVAAYNAAKAVDPTCKIGMAAQSVNLNYLEQALKAGARGHYDYITLHPYEILDGVGTNAGTEAVFMNIVPRVHQMLAAQDPPRKDAPVWFTEIGFDAGKNEQLQADSVVKVYSMGIAQGVAVINWFEGMDGDSGPMGLLKADGTPRPSYTAMAQMIRHFGPYPTYVGWVLLNGRDYAFVFRGAKGTVMTTWARKADRIDFGRAVLVVDPKSGGEQRTRTYTLTGAPILVTDVPEALVGQAARNRKKPFPWGGDYTGARTITIKMDEPVHENGLHLLPGEAIAKAVTIYGGSARAGDVPGGTAFIVDPNFLSYKAIPLTITALVRRGPQDGPAQLTLEYESVKGYEKTKPFEIPDGAGWHKATWTVDDPQFVSKWAYNFRFDAGKYYLKEVSVTKADR